MHDRLMNLFKEVLDTGLYFDLSLYPTAEDVIGADPHHVSLRITFTCEGAEPIKKVLAFAERREMHVVGVRDGLQLSLPLPISAAWSGRSSLAFRNLCRRPLRTRGGS
jgi:hypothetical protein